MNSLWQN